MSIQPIKLYGHSMHTTISLTTLMHSLTKFSGITPNPRKVLVILEELGIPYELVRNYPPPIYRKTQIYLTA